MKNHRNLGFIIPPLHYAALAVAQTHVPSVQIQGCRSTRPVTKRESRFVQGEQHNVYLELALIHNTRSRTESVRSSSFMASGRRRQAVPSSNLQPDPS